MVTPEEIFPYVLAPVIVFLIQYIITKIFEFEDRKKKKSIWIKFLRKTNGNINKCLSEFEKIESTNKKWIEFSKPIISLSAFLVVFVIFIIILIFSKDVYVSMAFASFIVSIFVCLMVVILYQYTDGKINEGNLLNKSNKIKDFYTIINWSFLGICSLVFPSIYGTIVFLGQIPISDLEKIRLYILFQSV